LKQLVGRKLARRQRRNQTLVKNCPLYFLTENGAKFLGLNRSKTIPIGATAISNHLGLLWYCSIEQHGQFKRVENSELETILGCKLHQNKVHVVGKVDNRIVVLRRYRPDSGLPNEKRKKLNKIVKELPVELESAVLSGDYGLLLLEQLPCGVELMKQQLGKAHKGQPFSKRIRTVVGVGPSTRTFPTVFERQFAKH
jgi:hypothetical protein